jgi:hypothetical protein
LFERIVLGVEYIGTRVIDYILDLLLEEITGEFDYEVFSGENLGEFVTFFMLWSFLYLLLFTHTSANLGIWIDLLAFSILHSFT